MRIEIDRLGNSEALFFTAGNLPSQKAFDLTFDDVERAFVAAVMRRNTLLCAASFYFESSFTRRLVDRYPSLWRGESKRAVFFINNDYPNFREHGFGKRAKSPPIFSPYVDLEQVQNYGDLLDGLGTTGVRQDVDISERMSQAWVSSCLSDEPGSIGYALEKLNSESFQADVSGLIQLARSRQYDFIWPSIEPQILANPRIIKAAKFLQRKHAEIYAQITAETLNAVEASPSVDVAAPSRVTSRSHGDIYTFASVLRGMGLSLDNLRSDAILNRVLDLDELEFIRRLHDDLVDSAIGIRREIVDSWRSVGIAEAQIASASINHFQMGQAIRDCFSAFGLKDNRTFFSKILSLEKIYDGQFLSSFVAKVESIMVKKPAFESKTGRKEYDRSTRDSLLFVSANPGGGLRVDKEYKEIDDILDGLRDRQTITLGKPVFSANVGEIQRRILSVKPTHFHFSGHGDPDGKVYFETEKADQPVSIGALVDTLVIISEPKCVLFNSCFSASGIEGIGDKIEYAVLMGEEIGDAAALSFSRGFYLALGSGLSIEKAFELGCNAIDLEELPDIQVPRLYHRGALIRIYSKRTHGKSRIS